MSATAEPRIPCLDGVRAICIGSVIVTHLVGEPAEHPWFYTFGDVGNLGVRTFFVISGFLITTLLLSELQRTGRISLSQFYLRRTFRIFPAFYAYIAVVAIAHKLGFAHLREHDLLAAATYTMNYHNPRAWEVGHLWTLAVEEQFYLLWPALVVWLGKRGGLGVALAAIVAAPIVRVLTHALLPEARDSIGESFQTVADSLATGCALALVRDRMSEMPRLVRFQRHAATPLLFVAVALLANAFHSRVSFGYSVGETISNIAIVLAVDACVRNPEGTFSRMLEWKPLIFVGTLSYSIYIWQQPLLPHHGRSTFTSFPLNLAIVAALALASHYGIEKPMLELRKRLFRRPRPIAGSSVQNVS